MSQQILPGPEAALTKSRGKKNVQQHNNVIVQKALTDALHALNLLKLVLPLATGISIVSRSIALVLPCTHFLCNISTFTENDFRIPASIHLASPHVQCMNDIWGKSSLTTWFVFSLALQTQRMDILNADLKGLCFKWPYPCLFHPCQYLICPKWSCGMRSLRPHITCSCFHWISSSTSISVQVCGRNVLTVSCKCQEKISLHAK